MLIVRELVLDLCGFLAIQKLIRFILILAYYICVLEYQVKWQQEVHYQFAGISLET